VSQPERIWERRVDAVLGIAASALLLVLMALTFVDVVARYLFNRPIRGAFELTELTLLVLIFAGLPLVSHADEHVTMDFIDRMLPERAVAILIRAVHALVAAVLPACSPPALPKPAQTVAPTPTSTARISTRLMIDSFPVAVRPLES